MYNYCNGHGVCVESNSTCNCYEGWGADNEIASYKAPDCSVRTCPSGRAWGALPTSTTDAHPLAECSNMGKCDRTTGLCRCKKGFDGIACQRYGCPNDCSGHGRCVSMRELAASSNGYPISRNTKYEMQADGTGWDADMIFGCLCDSGWKVGLDSNETQEAEYFGPDCSLRHCPSGRDPKEIVFGDPTPNMGTPRKNATDCSYTRGYWAKGVGDSGDAGNLCQVDCSNRGICDYKTGTCSCFKTFFGENCGIYSP